MDTANRSGVALSSRRVSFAFDLLATFKAVGGNGSLAQSLVRYWAHWMNKGF